MHSIFGWRRGARSICSDTTGHRYNLFAPACRQFSYPPREIFDEQFDPGREGRVHTRDRGGPDFGRDEHSLDVLRPLTMPTPTWKLYVNFGRADRATIGMPAPRQGIHSPRCHGTRYRSRDGSRFGDRNCNRFWKKASCHVFGKGSVK